jgi:type II secretory pathway component PulF
MAGQLDIVSTRVREGQSFAAALEARRVFPEVAVKMAEVGESTGALQDMLNTVADFYDEEIATNMERFVTLVEPVLSSSWVLSSPACCWRSTCRSSSSVRC